MPKLDFQTIGLLRGRIVIVIWQHEDAKSLYMMCVGDIINLPSYPRWTQPSPDEQKKLIHALKSLKYYSHDFYSSKYSFVSTMIHSRLEHQMIGAEYYPLTDLRRGISALTIFHKLFVMIHFNFASIWEVFGVVTRCCWLRKCDLMLPSGKIGRHKMKNDSFGEFPAISTIT